MPQLVERCAKPIDRLLEMFGPGHANIVILRGVIGLPAADPYVRPRRLDQRLCNGKSQRLIPCRDGGHGLFAQSITLVDVENGEALQESYLSRLAIRAARNGVALLGREPIGIADGSAPLPLADIAAHG
jgi:hypothetical protein